MKLENQNPNCQNETNLHGKTSLGAFLAGIVFVWGFLLPAISQLPAEKRWETFLEEQNIDPSAMFYSELETLPELLQRLRSGEVANQKETHGPTD